jgi:NAD(P)-dependent dehydrogenase (short-subunit alcohol dehydrogenase family)
MDHFTRCLALDEALKPRGAKVCSLAPGVIDTDMGAQTFVRRMAVIGSNDMDLAREQSIRMHPIGRLGVPEDIALTIVFLASDDARFMTGSALVVDGGVTAQ